MLFKREAIRTKYKFLTLDPWSQVSIKMENNIADMEVSQSPRIFFMTPRDRSQNCFSLALIIASRTFQLAITTAFKVLEYQSMWRENSVAVMYTTLTMSQITVLFKWLRLDARDARVVNGCQEPVRVSSGVWKLEHYWREV